ncbi:MAG: hypothetical protein JW889_15070 [Verrucomicrobia bacterium]|nr:hypothetical protein [Verrucomicrobiota bacterium]
MAVLLDKIIDGMWREGWDPDASDINLFVRDFGLVLASSVLSLLGGDLVFRSEEDLSHLSIWWPVFQVEAFPFHKVYKRLYVSQGESIVSFVRGVSTLLNPQDGAGR